MAKRKPGDGAVTQLRPDDSGWLAELRLARTDPVDLAGESGDERPAWADEATLHREPTAAETPDDSGSDVGTEDRPSPWAPPLSPMPVSPIQVPPIPLSPPAAPHADRPVWTLPPAEPPQWSLALPAPLSAPPVLSAPPGLTTVATRFPQPPPPARWLPDPIPEPLYYHDITPQRFEEPRRSARGSRDLRRRRRTPRWAIMLPVVALAGGTLMGLAYRSAQRPADPPPAAPSEGPLSVVATSITDQGSTVRLTWTDPTDGEATFVISEITADGARPLREVPPGQTETVIVGLDPAAAQYCFRVLAVRGGQTAASATTCTPARIVGS
jgi:hypothetical protein